MAAIEAGTSGKQKRGARPNAGAGWYVLGAAGLLGGAGLVREGSLERWRRPWSRAVLGGFAAGAGLALLALLKARRVVEADQGEDEKEEPSFARRVIASIPFKKTAEVKG